MTQTGVRRYLEQFAGLVGVVGSLVVVGHYLATAPASGSHSPVLHDARQSPYLIASPLVVGWRCDANLSVLLDDSHLTGVERKELHADLNEVLDTLSTHSPYRLEGSRCLIGQLVWSGVA